MNEQDKLKQFYEEHCKGCGSIVCSDCWCEAADGCLYYCHEILNKKSRLEELQEILYRNKQI